MEWTEFYKKWLVLRVLVIMPISAVIGWLYGTYIPDKVGISIFLIIVTVFILVISSYFTMLWIWWRKYGKTTN